MHQALKFEEVVIDWQHTCSGCKQLAQSLCPDASQIAHVVSDVALALAWIRLQLSNDLQSLHQHVSQTLP